MDKETLRLIEEIKTLAKESDKMIKKQKEQLALTKQLLKEVKR